jgi:hypothetical protein
VGVGNGYRGQERLGVRVTRSAVDLFDGPNLDDLSEVHDGHAVCDVSNDREIVRNEQIRQAELTLQVLQQVDDAGLNADVEGRYGFVEHQQLGFDSERSRDTDPLTLATRELVRITVSVFGVEPDHGEKFRNALGFSSRGKTVCS